PPRRVARVQRVPRGIGRQQRRVRARLQPVEAVPGRDVPLLRGQRAELHDDRVRGGFELSRRRRGTGPARSLPGSRRGRVRRAYRRTIIPVTTAAWMTTNGIAPR